LSARIQSLFDSMRPLAVQLRDGWIDTIAEGKSEQAIIEFVVQRYGRKEILYGRF